MSEIKTESKVHNDRKVKNLLMLGLLLLFVVFVFAITIVKLRIHNEDAEGNPIPPVTQSPASDTKPANAEPVKAN